MFLTWFVGECVMSINSINHDEMANITDKWDFQEQERMDKKVSDKQVRSAEARRRIETMREIRESGLTIEEAKTLGLLH